MEHNLITNVSRSITEETTRMLWGVSAGMCEFRGCKRFLYSHHVTKENVNQAQRAHIYAFSEGGKRFSKLLSRDKINDIDNLMLTCGGCHALIDSSNTNYSAEELFSMKKEHEERVKLLVSIKPDLQSEVVIYNCNIGDKPIRIQDYQANSSITPEFYPSNPKPINLSPDIKLYDNEQDYWGLMSKHLERRLFHYEPSLRDKHISLFAIAPQPLLFKLGTLLNRNYNVSVRQSQGDVSKWKWQNEEQTLNLQVQEFGNNYKDKVVISVEITAHLSDEEIKNIFECYRVFRIITEECDSQAIKSPQDLDKVRNEYRCILSKIRQECASNVQVCLLPLAPASVSIELGRHTMKGDPIITIYDRDFLTKEWKPVLTVPNKEIK